MRIEPPLLGPEIEAICRHFGSGESTENVTGGNPADVVGSGSAERRRLHGHVAVSYRAFLAWIDPVDVRRVAKR